MRNNLYNISLLHETRIITCLTIIFFSYVRFFLLLITLYYSMKKQQGTLAYNETKTHFNIDLTIVKNKYIMEMK